MIISAFVLYLVSHVLRTLRYWLIYNDDKLSLRWAFVVFHVTASMGYWMPVLLSEVVRVLWLWWICRDGPRVLAAELLSRALDLLCLGLIVSLGSGQREAGFVGLVIGAFVVLFLLSAKQLVRPLKAAIIGRMHSETAVRALRGIDVFGRVSETIARGSLPILGVTVALTFGVWLLDAFAARFMLVEASQSLELGQMLHYWASNSFSNMVGGTSVLTSEQVMRLQNGLFFPQTVLSGVLVVIFGVWACVRRKR